MNRLYFLLLLSTSVTSAAVMPKPCALAAAATGGGYTFTLTLCPATLLGGSESWGSQILLNVPPNSDPGITFALLSNNPAAIVPNVVTVPGGSTTQIFHIRTLPVSVETQVRITVIYAGVSTDATLTLAPPPSSCAADVSAAVSVKRNGLTYSRATGRWVQTVILRNISTAAVAGPLSMVLTGLSSNATLYTRSGFTACISPPGSPYREVSPAGYSLAPGASRTVLLEFTNPGNQAITYSTLVTSGANR